LKTIISHYLKKFQGNDLKARCARGSLALSMGTIIAKALALVSKIILTRLLVNNEIGLMVMILSLISFMEAFVEVGVKKSIVQSKDGDTPDYLNMAWWFQGTRCVLLYCVAFLISPWLSRFYFSNKPAILELYTVDELCILLRVAFLYILFNGFTSPRMQILSREFKFFKKVMLGQGTAAVGIIITIILAFRMRNIWAIVIGNLSGMALLSIFSYVVCPVKPRFKLHKESLSSIFRFARGMAGLPILTSLAFNADVLVLGKVMDTAVVDMYGMALVLANIPRDLFTKIINPVLLPAFAAKQYNPTGLNRGILSLSKIIAIATLPGAVVAAGCGKTILSIIYPDKYAEVSAVFGVFCFYIGVMIQSMPLSQAFYGIGRPEKLRLYVIIRCILISLLIYPAVNLYGIMGSAGILYLITLAGVFFQVQLLKAEIGLCIKSYLMSWLPGLIGAFIEAAALTATILLLPGHPYLQLGIGIVSCSFIITAILFQQIRTGAFSNKQ